MAITIGTLSPIISGLSYQTWGITLIDKEFFVGIIGTNTSIYVYDIDTHVLKRTLTTSSFSSSIGTDGTNLLVKNSSNQIVTINKTTGTTISTKTNTTFLMSNTANFKVDLINDRIYYCDYNTTLYIKKYSDGSLLASYTIPANATGVEIVNNKYIIVCSKGVNKYLNIAPLNSNINTLSFTQYILSSSGVGVVYYNGNLIFSSYDGNSILSGTISGLNLITIKYLIKQNESYYTIKNTNYDFGTNHNFTALILTGGLAPNKSDIETFGFDDLSVLTTDMSVNTDTFIPITKLNNQFEIKMYKG